MNDQSYMRQALALAKKAKGFTSPNPCVGAVIVKNDTVAGQGFHRAAGRPHAEVEAIADAGSNTKGAAIYVTLEPCNHYGKTPPCTRAIIDAGIKRVVIGCRDPNPDVAGNGIQTLKENGIEVVSGILESQAKALIEDFIWFIRHRTPFVTLKCAATLDGRIATVTGDSKWITSAASRQYAHKIRNDVDAILVGSGTLHADNPSLTSRINDVKTKDPVRVILDTRLSIDPDAKVLNQSSDAVTIIAAGPDISHEKKKRVEDKGARVLQLPLKGNKLDLHELMIKLGQMSILSLLIEGGSVVAGTVLREQMVNKVLYFIAPKFIGGNDGFPVFDGQGVKLIQEAFTLKDVSTHRFDDDILVQGYI